MRTKPPTPTQLAALATFYHTGKMTTDGRVVNALVRRGLVTRALNQFDLTDAGKALAASPSGRQAARGVRGVKCIVDGCPHNVFGPHNMCSQHLTRWLDGRLKPKSQGAA